MNPSVAKNLPAPAGQRFPIVIGVTGHRDLRQQDIPALQDQVRQCLDELRGICPHTPMVLLSPLAEGADRLVAEVALAAGVSLVVPLPLARVEYEKDFVHDGDAALTAKSLTEFDVLLKRAARHFELPLTAGNAADGTGRQGAERDRQYQQVGAYIVRHSHILIALWDGESKQDESVGGTGQIVRFRLDGLPAEFSPLPNPLDAVDAGPVLHVVTPRTRNPQLPPGALTRQVVLPGAGGAAAQRYGEVLADTPYAATLRRHDGYNRDVARLGTEMAASIATNRSHVVSAAQAATLDDAARSILDHYAMADTLALHFQQRRRRVLVALFSMAAAAVFFFELYAHGVPRPWMLALYPLTLLAGFGVYRFARSRDYHNKHLDYRALAEGLRVQLFWQLAGMMDEVSDHYLRKQRSELEWVRLVLRTQLRMANNWSPGVAERSPASQDRLHVIRNLVLPHWVVDQGGFFAGATRRDHHKLERRERWERRLVVIGIVTGALLLLLPLLGAQPYSVAWQHFLLVVMGFGPAVAAAISGYTERMAFAPQAKRYHWMAELFARAEARLRAAGDAGNDNEARQIMLELGNEALGENGDWVMMHRERPPEASKVG